MIMVMMVVKLMTIMMTIVHDDEDANDDEVWTIL